MLDVPFHYATEGFFQVNIPVYEQALRDMKEWVESKTEDCGPKTAESMQTAPADTTTASEPEASAFPAAARQDISVVSAERGSDSDGSRSGRTQATVDLYSGVGTIGLTIGGENCVLVETDENAVREMKRNVSLLNSSSQPVLARSEDALEYITSDRVIIVDPPRAGMHTNVINRLLEALPPRIIYLSCNPVTQARDVALLLEKYNLVHHRGYNFFPRTPHIEHLVVLERAA